MKSLRRTMLFIPGNTPAMLQDAGILGADSIILDLEDAVSIEEKDSARNLVREALRFVDYSECEIVVRVNPINTEFGIEDVNIIARAKPQALMIPKADEEEIITVNDLLCEIEEQEGIEHNSIKIFPLIESAYGLENVYSIVKASKRVTGVLLGGEDLTSDLGIRRTKEGQEIFYARNKVAAVCRAAGISAIDTPFTDTNDFEGLRKDTAMGKSLGMTGKAAINPRQIEGIHDVFAPNEEEIQRALRILTAEAEAKREGKGVFSLDGKMVDAPIINRAAATVNLAKMLGLI